MNRLKEWLLGMAGMKIWPPTHDDPRIQGPQPRILTRRQHAAMEKMRRSEGVRDESTSDKEAK
ncbi:MAG: hypothetical protein IKR48_02555 [Kiritimatiellae bacterium]|nr:hypothetical protein [Kiritimatiellia bacterium]